MNLIGGIVALGVLAFLVVGVRELYKKGVADGTLKGYERGRLDAENWWTAAEQGVDLARQEIWRNEERKEKRP